MDNYQYLFDNSESFYNPVKIKNDINKRMEKEMIENKGKEENYTFIRDFYKILKEYFKKRKNPEKNPDFEEKPIAFNEGVNIKTSKFQII